MKKAFRRLKHDERGMALVVVGLGVLGLLAACMLAIDVGMIATARAQAQNSADAGALAGAVALGFNDFNNRSASGPAVQSAMNAALENDVMSKDVSVKPSDVTFPNDSSGDPTLIQVQVFRTAQRSNPLTLLISKLIGMANSDTQATATAQAAPANAMTCVKPFTIPDKWIERQTPPWDPSDTFDPSPASPPDMYIPASTSTAGTGYKVQEDIGTTMLLKAATGANITPSFYFALALPGSTGADDYRWNIANCNTTVGNIGDPMTPEPGNMVGPTKQGVEERIAMDPSAYWDPANKKVVSSYNPSPRVIGIPLYDPQFYETGKQEGRPADLKMANFLGFFLIEMQGNSVYGVITPIGALHRGNGGPPRGGFAQAIRLID